jgi:hemerythrin superfamily protein
MTIDEIKKLLDDIEDYSPTIPLSYDKYHEIIRELIAQIENHE